MNLIQTTMRPTDGGFWVEMTFGDLAEPDGFGESLRFVTKVESHPEGSPQLAKLERVALQRVQDAIAKHIRSR